MEKPYYFAYEDRYQKVFQAGVERWGHSPDNKILFDVLSEWVSEHNLAGKRIIEYGCGEGASGVILSELGCIYHGVDIAPAAVKKTSEALKRYKNATAGLLDMANQRVPGMYDAALDVMAFHMLVLDPDRAGYLANAIECLQSGAPMLFFRELYQKDAFDGIINTFDEWVSISGSDYKTPIKRTMGSADEVEVYIPLVPGRSKTEKGYKAEMQKAGFIVVKWSKWRSMNNVQIPYLFSSINHKHKKEQPDMAVLFYAANNRLSR